MAVASAALAAARRRIGADSLDDILETAYAEWAYLAEEELQSFTGTQLGKRGERGRRPNLVWRSVIPEKKFVQRYSRAADAGWLGGIAGELVCISSVSTAAARPGPRGSGQPSSPPPPVDGDGGDMDAMLIDDMGDWDTDGDIGPEGDIAEDSTADAGSAERRGRKPPMRQWRCLQVLREIRASLDDDQSAGEPDLDLAELRHRLINVVENTCTSIDGGAGADDGEPAMDARGGRDADPWHAASATRVAACLPLARGAREELREIGRKAELAQRC